MKNDQCYIGTPNGVVLCLDIYSMGQTKGRIYHRYTREPIEISSLEEMIFFMEDFFNQINYPFPGTCKW